MLLAAQAITAISGLLHLWFFVLETFLWTKPIGIKTFGNDPAFAQASARLAGNMGIYNCALAVGLLISAVTGAPELWVYTLCFVIGVGIYGAATVGIKILWIQTLPAAVALGLLMFARSQAV